VIRVLIADDQALVRGGFRVLVDSAPDLEVIGEAVDGAQAVELALRLRPDVVLMDIRMPVMDGLEATRRILAGQGPPPEPMIRVLILTTFDLDEYVYRALKLGASGFLLKDTRPVELLDGIRLVHAGEALLSPTVLRQLIEEFVSGPDPADVTGSTGPTGLAPLVGLTEREREVLELVAQGWSNAEIGTRLYVTPATVKTHVSRLLMKLQARDRAQLIVLCYERGLMSHHRPMS
jgi:DNA-binding NarL/FixJ family response regulator